MKNTVHTCGREWGGTQMGIWEGSEGNKNKIKNVVIYILILKMKIIFCFLPTISYQQLISQIFVTNSSLYAEVLSFFLSTVTTTLSSHVQKPCYIQGTLFHCSHPPSLAVTTFPPPSSVMILSLGRMGMMIQISHLGLCIPLSLILCFSAGHLLKT